MARGQWPLPIWRSFLLPRPQRHPPPLHSTPATLVPAPQHHRTKELMSSPCCLRSSSIALLICARATHIACTHD